MADATIYVLTMQVEPSSEMRKLLQAASKLQKKKGDSYLGAIASQPYRA